MARVLVVASLASSLIRFRGDLLRELRAGGHDVVTAAPDPDDSTCCSLLQMGVRCHHTPLSRSSLNPFGDLTYYASLRRVIDRERPDVVLAYTPKPVIYSGLACRGFRGVRHYALISGLGYGFGQETLRQRLLTPLLRSLFAAALARSEGVIFQNPDDRELFIERRIVAADRCTLVNGSGVDVHRFNVEPLPAAPTFLLMARLIPEKGVREFIAAARQIRMRRPRARFLLAGWIEARRGAISPSEVQEWVREGVVEYLGALEDVRPAIAQSSVYVLPSYYREGVPRSVIEAMSMGRAVITTDAPGCRETVVDGENGFLVPPRDADALAGKIERLAADTPLSERMGAASRRIAEERFEIRRINADMMRAMEIAA